MDVVHMADVALAVAALEACALLVAYRLGNRVPAPRDWGLNLLSGACLMVALRLALAGAPWPAWAAALSAAGAAHVADLVGRWRRLRPS